MILTDKCFDRIILLQLYILYRMGCDEAILTDHQRQSDIGMLRDPVSHQVIIIYLLIILGIELYEA